MRQRYDIFEIWITVNECVSVRETANRILCAWYVYISHYGIYRCVYVYVMNFMIIVSPLIVGHHSMKWLQPKNHRKWNKQKCVHTPHIVPMRWGAVRCGGTVWNAWNSRKIECSFFIYRTYNSNIMIIILHSTYFIYKHIVYVCSIYHHECSHVNWIECGHAFLWSFNRLILCAINASNELYWKYHCVSHVYTHWITTVAHIFNDADQSK